MPAAEAATALYLFAAEPGTTSAGARRGQQLLFLPVAPREGGTFIPAADTATGFSTEPPTLEAGVCIEAYRTASAGEDIRTAADTVVAQLIRMEKWDANWDGAGADKPLGFSLRSARDFVRALAPESVVPQPALHADGHAILFLRGSNVYAELEFLEGKRIGFYARRGEQEWADEFDFDGYTLPEGLFHIGFTVYEPAGVAAA